MPNLYYIFAWLIVMSAQLVIIPRMTISGIFPDFALATAILLGLKRGWKMGLWFGFAFGLSMGFVDPVNLGWITLLFSVAGLISGLIREKIYVENNLYQIGIVSAVTFLYQLSIRLASSVGYMIDNIGISLLDSLLIGVYTALVSWVVLIILQQRYRLKELM